MPKGGKVPPLGAIAKSNGYTGGSSSSKSGGEFSMFNQASGNSGGSSGSSGEINSPFGPIKGMHHSGGNDHGGTHHTVYTEGSRFSWDTNAKGDVVPGSAHSKKQ